MKKFLSFCLIVVACFAVIALTGFEKSDGAYQGSLSAHLVDGIDSAIEYYLDDELSGECAYAEYESHTVEKELSQNEIKRLGVTDKDLVDLLKVEQVAVEFKMYSTPDDDSEQSEAEIQRKTIYVFTYNDGWCKYYTGKVSVGETLTQSYLDSVFDVEKFVSCAIKSDMKLSMKVKDAESDLDLSIEILQDSKIDKDAVWAQTAVKAGGKSGGTSVSSEVTVEKYDFLVESAIKEAVKQDTNWTVNDLPYASMEYLKYDAFRSAFGNYDATYFQKTKDGFELKAESAKKWFVDYCKSMAQNQQELDAMLQMLDNLTINYKVSVRDGNIVSVNVNAGFSVSQNGATVSLNISGFNTFGDYGTTTVTVPQDV